MNFSYSPRLRNLFGAATPVAYPHPQRDVRLVEVTINAPDSMVGQLAGKDAVHETGSQSIEEIRTHRLGGAAMDRTCYAMMDAQGILHAAIYVHKGITPIERYSDLAGDVMPILTSTPSILDGDLQSLHCYSISGQLADVQGMGRILIQNLHNHLIETTKPNVVISTLSPMRDFDKVMQGRGMIQHDWMNETPVARRFMVMHYLTQITDPVQKFHMGNGAIIGSVRLSEGGVGDSAGQNRCMINYIYDRDPLRLKSNAARFKTCLTQGTSIVAAGLVDRSLESEIWGMAESRTAQKMSVAACSPWPRV